MKKISKLIYFIIAFALITCMAILNPAITFADAVEPSLSGEDVSISTGKMASVLENGKQLNIPMPTEIKNATGAKSYVEVKDRSGYTYTYDIDTAKTYDKDGNETEYFNLLKDDGITATTEASEVKFIQPKIVGKGVYTIRYKVEKGAKTYYTSAQTVQVKSIAYNWEFNAENTKKNIIPANSDATTSYSLPMPKIIDGSKEENEDGRISATYTVADKGTKIIVTKDGTDVSENALVVDGENLVFTPSLTESEQSAVYRIRYISKVQGFSNKEYEIKVSKDYKVKAELEVTHNSITNVQVGAKTTFPTANVEDKTHNKSKVEVNTVITIKKGSTVVKTLEPNEYGYKFEEAGTYTITYEVTDAYGNTAKSSAYSITVTDRGPYVIDYAEDYAVNNGEVEGDVTTGVSYLIPNEIGYGGVWLPAIYAMDYVDGYNLTFTRRIELSTDSSKYYDIDKAKGEHGNGALTEDNTKYNEKIKFEFPEDDASKHAGETYKVKYFAKDTNGNEVSATVYTFKVADVETLSYNVDKGLSIKFPSIVEHLDVESELKFTSASASETPNDSKIIADERLDVRTYYYYGDKTEVENAIDTYKISGYEKYAYNFEAFYTAFSSSKDVKKLNSKDGYTTIKLDSAEADGKNKVTIFAVAINDQGQFVVKAQEVAIDNVTETDIPEIISVATSSKAGVKKVDITSTSNVFNQNYDIYLPEIQFGDTTDDSLEVTVECYVNTPDNTVGVVIEEFAKNGIKLAKVHAGSYGTYYVVYTARDDAGNTKTYISTFDVEEVKKASVVVTNGSKFSKKVGETLSLVVELQGEGEYTDFAYDIVWDKNPGGLGSNKDSYLLEKDGTFNATINATYKLNGEEYTTSTTVTVTVSAVSVDWSNVESELVNRKEYVGKVYLPFITVKENGNELNAYPTVKLVKDDKETDVEVKLDADMISYYFEAEDGTYKVTYTVDSKYSTNRTKSFTITCGDIYEPTVVIEDNKLEGSTFKFNGEITVTASLTENGSTGKYKLVVKGTNSEGTVFDYEMPVSITDKNKDQAIEAINASDYSFELTGDSCSSDGTNKWKITGVGTYKLNLTVKDKNGNATTKTIEFTISNKSEAKKNYDNVVGIVLIVISAVVLGGVILFFAFAGKKKSKKKLSK